MLCRRDVVWNWAITRCRSTSPTPPTDLHSFSPAHAQNATILNLQIPPMPSTTSPPHSIHMRTNHRHNQQNLDFDGSVRKKLTVLMQTPISPPKKTNLQNSRATKCTHLPGSTTITGELFNSQLLSSVYPIPPKQPNQTPNSTPAGLSKILATCHSVES